VPAATATRPQLSADAAAAVTVEAWLGSGDWYPRS
jgi:hypothetical protein